MYTFSYHSDSMFQAFQHILYLSVISSSLLLTTSCYTNKKPAPPKKKQFHITEKPEWLCDSISFNASLTPVTVTVYAPINGIIELFRVKPNETVLKGSVLARFDNHTAFGKLSEKKQVFKERIETTLSELPVELAVIKPKWNRYCTTISAEQFLPDLPSFEYREELQTFKDKGVIELRNAIVADELNLRSYFVQAPVSGILIGYTETKNNYFKKNTPFCTLAIPRSAYLKTNAVLHKGDTIAYNDQQLIVSHEKQSANGKFVYRVSITTTPQKISSGIAHWSKRYSVIKIPSRFLKGSVVWVYKNGQIYRTPITRKKVQYGYGYVTGLSSDDTLLIPSTDNRKITSP